MANFVGTIEAVVAIPHQQHIPISAQVGFYPRQRTREQVLDHQHQLRAVNLLD
ncbi:MAG: hypothetical protein WC740_19415 [Verrucomicrobiia bacterium]